jgi:hypothetical protein
VRGKKAEPDEKWGIAVLFTAYLSWGEAPEAGKRTGTRRVVAGETDPASMVEDSAAQDP